MIESKRPGERIDEFCELATDLVIGGIYKTEEFFYEHPKVARATKAVIVGLTAGTAAEIITGKIRQLESKGLSIGQRRDKL